MEHGRTRTHLLLEVFRPLTLLFLSLFLLSLGEPSPIALESLDENVFLSQLGLELEFGRLSRRHLPLERRVCQVRGECLSSLQLFSSRELWAYMNGECGRVDTIHVATDRVSSAARESRLMALLRGMYDINRLEDWRRKFVAVAHRDRGGPGASRDAVVTVLRDVSWAAATG